MQKIEAYMSFFQNTLGPQSSFIVANVAKLPGVVADKIGVDMDIVPGEAEIVAKVGGLAQQLNPQAQQEQAEQAAIPPQVPPPK